MSVLKTYKNGVWTEVFGVPEHTSDELILTHNNDNTAHEDIRSAVEGKANKSEGAFFIEGTGTTDSTAKTSTWTGASDRITEYYDGLTIRYKIGVAGQTTTTLNINNLGAKTIYLFNTTKLTTQFPVNSIINLIYHADLNSGCWVCSDYDSNTNTYQRVYPTTTNAEYPITARYATTTGSSYYAEYGRYSTGVTLNPSTNTITATKFKGALTGNADTATKATQDASGNVITSTYETKTDATSKLNEINSQISQLSSEIVDINLEIPVRGTHYWTEADQESIVQDVITALGVPVFGTVDENKHIILTGNLDTGTYAFSYMDKDGKLTELGTYTGGKKEDIIITPVWHYPYKLNSSTGVASADSANTYAYSDGIPFEDGTELWISSTDRNYFAAHWYYYDANDNFVGKQDWLTNTTPADGVVPMPAAKIPQMTGASVVKLRCNVSENGRWDKLDWLTVVRKYV